MVPLGLFSDSSVDDIPIAYVAHLLATCRDLIPPDTLKELNLRVARLEENTPDKAAYDAAKASAERSNPFQPAGTAELGILQSAYERVTRNMDEESEGRKAINRYKDALEKAFKRRRES